MKSKEETALVILSQKSQTCGARFTRLRTQRSTIQLCFIILPDIPLLAHPSAIPILGVSFLAVHLLVSTNQQNSMQHLDVTRNTRLRPLCHIFVRRDLSPKRPTLHQPLATTYLRLPSLNRNTRSVSLHESCSQAPLAASRDLKFSKQPYR